MRRVLLRPLVWLALAVPGLLMTANLLRGDVLALDLLHPSGEMAVRLLVLALLPGPLAGVFGPNRWLRGWLGWRRNIGVAAFGYALLHTGFYLIDVGALAPAMAELGLPAIWTGWLALLAMLAPAATSFDRAMVRLGRRTWKTLQRLAYGAAVLTIAHWLLLDWRWQGALLHAAPVLAVWLILALRRVRAGATLQGEPS